MIYRWIKLRYLNTYNNTHNSRLFLQAKKCWQYNYNNLGSLEGESPRGFSSA